MVGATEPSNLFPPSTKEYPMTISELSEDTDEWNAALAADRAPEDTDGIIWERVESERERKNEARIQNNIGNVLGRRRGTCNPRWRAGRRP